MMLPCVKNALQIFYTLHLRPRLRPPFAEIAFRKYFVIAFGLSDTYEPIILARASAGVNVTSFSITYSEILHVDID